MFDATMGFYLLISVFLGLIMISFFKIAFGRRT